MLETIVVGISHPKREKAEAFIRAVYAAQYRATIQEFPPRLIALVDGGNSVVCAAGLRSESDGFFSERYLSAPIERVLSELADRAVSRKQLFEVSTLASLSPRNVVDFISRIVEFGRDHGFTWSFFTLTKRLAKLINRIGLSPIHLAEADHRRIENFEQWGTYYATHPMVYAVANHLVTKNRFLTPRTLHHA